MTADVVAVIIKNIRSASVAWRHAASRGGACRRIDYHASLVGASHRAQLARLLSEVGETLRMLRARFAGAVHWGGTLLRSKPQAEVVIRGSLSRQVVLIMHSCRCSMWAYLTLFYASGPDLAVAWSFIAAAQPLAQVRQSDSLLLLHPTTWPTPEQATS